MIYKSDNHHDNQIYDDAYFRQLGKDLEEKTIKNLREELKDLSNV